jgi:hypothetical protein
MILDFRLTILDSMAASRLSIENEPRSCKGAKHDQMVTKAQVLKYPLRLSAFDV